MAYTDIDDPTINFNTVTYTGNVDESSSNGSQAITGVGFQPDWIWIKPYIMGYAAGSHNVTDSVRGAGKSIFPDLTGAEYDYGTNANGGAVISIDSDGFTLGGASQVNEDSNTYVSWNWLAGGSTSSNSDGSITTTVSANTTAGFSIVSYTGTGSNATIGHSLGIAPKMIIVKKRNGSSSWLVYNKNIGNNKLLYLNGTQAEVSTDATFMQNTDPTSSVFTVGTWGDINGSSDTYIAYCFAEKKGYSKFGSYPGTGDADGPFVYTGFKPAWLMIKNSGRASTSWTIYDNKRPGYNSDNAYILAEQQDNELSDKDIDLLSSGFKPLLSNNAVNTDGDSYIYMAFAECPFVNSKGVPGTAR